MSEFMSRFLLSFKKGKKANDSVNGHKEAGFQKARTGDLMSKGTNVVNGTNQTLYLRDRIGSAYGNTRYKIVGNSHLEVFPLQHSFFRMIAYAVEEDKHVEGEDGESGSSGIPGQQSGKKRTSTDTNLTIDSDQLADNKEITITHDGSKYKLTCVPRFPWKYLTNGYFFGNPSLKDL